MKTPKQSKREPDPKTDKLFSNIHKHRKSFTPMAVNEAIAQAREANNPGMIKIVVTMYHDGRVETEIFGNPNIPIAPGMANHLVSSALDRAKESHASKAFALEQQL